MKICGVVGVGGFGREVMPVAAAMLADELRANSCRLVFVTENEGVEAINGYPCIPENEFLAMRAERYFSLALSDGKLRHSLDERYQKSGARPFQVQAENCVLMDNNTLINFKSLWSGFISSLMLPARKSFHPSPLKDARKAFCFHQELQAIYQSN